MTNKEVLKAIIAKIPVSDGNTTYSQIMDYTVCADDAGNISYTAGCITADRVYHSVLCEQLLCNEDLKTIKITKPVWDSPYTAEQIIFEAMKDKKPVKVGDFEYQRITRLSVILDLSTKCLSYSATCVDSRGNTVTAKLRQIRINDLEKEEGKNNEIHQEAKECA